MSGNLVRAQSIWRAAEGRSPMSLVAWIVVGLLAWFIAAVLLALLIGRLVRRRDQQVPWTDPQGGGRHSPAQCTGERGCTTTPRDGCDSGDISTPE